MKLRQPHEISEDGVRSRPALDTACVRYWRLGALVFRPDHLDRSLSHPLCEVETDSSLGGPGDWTCSRPEERLTAWVIPQAIVEQNPPTSLANVSLQGFQPWMTKPTPNKK